MEQLEHNGLCLLKMTPKVYQDKHGFTDEEMDYLRFLVITSGGRINKEPYTTTIKQQRHEWRKHGKPTPTTT